ncbi:PIN domain-containing protein [uncultured Hymenobacter sp.]|uniref:PIN domain-containing protein n=1 Tax=uncultured Hymenobacter sp. TaxID=170016 RepID=UPI0035CC3526
MSQRVVVLDTNILVAVSKQQFNPAILGQHYEVVLTSVVCWAEALGFAFPTPAEQGRMELFLRGLEVRPFTMAEAQFVVQYRRHPQRKIKLPDAAILATARAAGATCSPKT